jgi:hypothetical protein
VGAVVEKELWGRFKTHIGNQNHYPIDSIIQSWEWDTLRYYIQGNNFHCGFFLK